MVIDGRAQMQAEATAAANEMLGSDPREATGSKMELVQPASAAVLSEEIVRDIIQGVVDVATSEPTEWSACVDDATTAVLALFAPVLAEKGREIARLKEVRKRLDHRIHCQRKANRDNWEIVERRRKWLGSQTAQRAFIHMRARALAAEAALAAERSQGLVLVPLEPTKAMLEALDGDGDRIWGGSTEHYFRNEDEAFWYARQVWAAMVRAAAIRSQEQP